jgi:hypothetical protein
MKIRMQPNSIRLRLKRAEVATLIKENIIEERMVFGGDQELRYCLQLSHNIENPQATFRAGEILVKVPYDRATHWALSSDVSIEGAQTITGQTQMQILVEKDFACLNGTAEQNVDAFPHPLAGTKC